MLAVESLQKQDTRERAMQMVDKLEDRNEVSVCGAVNDGLTCFLSLRQVLTSIRLPFFR